MNNNQNNADRRASERQAARLTAPISAPDQLYGEDITFGDNTSLGVDMPIGLDMSDITPAGVGADRTAGAAQAGMPGLYGVDMTDTVFAEVDALHEANTGRSGQPGLYGIDMTAAVHANLADALGEHRYPRAMGSPRDTSCRTCGDAPQPCATCGGKRRRRTYTSWRDQVEWPEYDDPADDPLGDQEVDPYLTMADILINLEAYTEPHRTYLDPHSHAAFYSPSAESVVSWPGPYRAAGSPVGLHDHPAFSLATLLNPLAPPVLFAFPSVIEGLGLTLAVERYLDCTLDHWRLSLADKRALRDGVAAKLAGYRAGIALPPTTRILEERSPDDAIRDAEHHLKALDEEIGEQESRADEWIDRYKGKRTRGQIVTNDQLRKLGPEDDPNPITSARERALVEERAQERLDEAKAKEAEARAHGDSDEADELKKEQEDIEKLLGHLATLPDADPCLPKEIASDSLKRLLKATRGRCFLGPIVRLFDEMNSRLGLLKVLPGATTPTQVKCADGTVQLCGHLFRDGSDDRIQGSFCGFTNWGIGGLPPGNKIPGAPEPLPIPCPIDLCELRKCGLPPEVLCEAKRYVVTLTLMHELLHWIRCYFPAQAGQSPTPEQRALHRKLKDEVRQRLIDEHGSTTDGEVERYYRALIALITSVGLTGHLGSVRLPDLQDALVELLGGTEYELLLAQFGDALYSNEAWWHLLEVAMMKKYGNRLTPGLRCRSRALGLPDKDLGQEYEVTIEIETPDGRRFPPCTYRRHAKD